MKLNRRSVLGAIGLAGVGTGAAFGSGAFSSTTAERAVEVNVFGAGDGPDGVVQDPSDDTEEEIADTITSNSVDVLVDTSDDDVTVRDSGGTDYDYDPESDNPGTASLFPSNTGTYDVGNEYVSLVANDVTVVFGNNGGLPPNATLGYDDLFTFVPNAGDSSSNFDVTFGSSDSPGDVLTKVDGKDVTTRAVVSVASGSSSSTNSVDAEVETTTTSPESERLDIQIEEQ
ncbi:MULTISPECIES: hypothetical protein [Halorubrum]|uniref:DUF1102 domain-containing protein n=1 Tax=Halorubrum hochstenium ATCC 700873 TaxID=1227481 RepID=M0F5Z4_9EURY|nr:MULTISPECIES: hypothetical protein [Halorubrum]ELZ54024.1 hypothetical protein C467_12252 [Halorubrum hochstenium ATCC 700873]